MIADEIPHDPDISSGQYIGDIIEYKQIRGANGKQAAFKQQFFLLVFWIKPQEKKAGRHGIKAVFVRRRHQCQRQDGQYGNKEGGFFEPAYGAVHALHQF